ncbi:hypothetical protein X975_00972, partial [Stegodyphus mimosarum]
MNFVTNWIFVMFLRLKMEELHLLCFTSVELQNKTTWILPFSTVLYCGSLRIIWYLHINATTLEDVAKFSECAKLWQPC